MAFTYNTRFFNKSKYGASKCQCSLGHTHDSKKEAKRCDELHLLLRLGEISELELQKEYLLIPALYKEIELEETFTKGEKKGKHKVKRVCEEKKVVYKADFVYIDKRLGKTVIEDCKGMRTTEYIIKRKLMKQLYCKGDKIVFIET